MWLWCFQCVVCTLVLDTPSGVISIATVKFASSRELATFAVLLEIISGVHHDSRAFGYFLRIFVISAPPPPPPQHLSVYRCRVFRYAPYMIPLFAM